MTDKPKLTAERYISKLRKRDATKDERLEDYLGECEARFLKRESAWRCDLLAEVVEAERAPAVAMAKALGLEIEEQPEEAPPASAPIAAPDPEPAGEEVPARLREPLSKERLAVGRK